MNVICPPHPPPPHPTPCSDVAIETERTSPRTRHSRQIKRQINMNTLRPNQDHMVKFTTVRSPERRRHLKHSRLENPRTGYGGLNRKITELSMVHGFQQAMFDDRRVYHVPYKKVIIFNILDSFFPHNIQPSTRNFLLASSWSIPWWHFHSPAILWDFATIFDDTATSFPYPFSNISLQDDLPSTITKVSTISDRSEYVWVKTRVRIFEA